MSLEKKFLHVFSEKNVARDIYSKNDVTSKNYL